PSGVTAAPATEFRCFRKRLEFSLGGSLQFGMSRRPRVAAAMTSLRGDGDRHAWTLEELHSALVERGHPSDFSSVFRAAEKLASAGIIRRLLLDDGRARFELSSAH